MVLREDIQQDLKRIESRVAMKNLREFEEKKLFPTMEHVQQAYIELCKDFSATPVTLTKFIRKGVFHFKN